VDKDTSRDKDWDINWDEDTVNKVLAMSTIVAQNPANYRINVSSIKKITEIMVQDHFFLVNYHTTKTFCGKSQTTTTATIFFIYNFHTAATLLGDTSIHRKFFFVYNIQYFVSEFLAVVSIFSPLEVFFF
jgi:hypothetical protein